MTTTKVKTSELLGAALDFAVAKADRLNPQAKNGEVLTLQNAARWIPAGQGEPAGYDYSIDYEKFSPSTEWAQGGPLIEKYNVRFDHRRVDNGRVIASACGMMFDHGIPGCDSYLVAACRAIVAAKLGDTVEIPTELLEAAN